jgi:membrane protease YdiL (CAAX protease family)
MQTALSRAWSPKVAVVLTSFCFGLAHYRLDALNAHLLGRLPIQSPVGGRPLTIWDIRWLMHPVETFAGGLYLGWLTELTTSVVPAMACHVVWGAAAQLGAYGWLYDHFSATPIRVTSALVCLATFIYLREEFRLMRRAGGAPVEERVNGTERE